MFTPEWYDRSGNRIDMIEANKLLSDRNYSVIGLTEVTSEIDPSVHRISTVWIGLNHRFGSGPPLIFETMVFTNGELIQRLCDRYSTEDESRTGHAEVVGIVAATTPHEKVRDVDGWPPD